MRLIDQKDFDCIGDVARHCDLKKLCISIDEAQIFDLGELFCDSWVNIEDIFNEIKEYHKAHEDFIKCSENCIEPSKPDNYDLKLNLIDGGNYIGCGGKIRTHLGVKRILVYYAYSRYVVINGFNDTPNGQVDKRNEWSLPKPLKEVQSFSEKYRTMGYVAYKKTNNFLCKHATELGINKPYDCKECGCADDCDNKTKAKGFGFKSSIISKNGLY